jgi:hypothetical protein
MKTSSKHKARIRRNVDIELRIEPPKSIIFASKKVYSRKLKHKDNLEKSKL